MVQGYPSQDSLGQVEVAPDHLKESTLENEAPVSPQSFGDIRIMVDIRMSNGIHI